MNITINSTNTSFHGLVPLKKYKGPILKLTQIDMEEIAALQKNIAQTELELYKLNSKNKGLQLRFEQQDFLWNLERRLNTRIENWREMIKEIKQNRLKIQKLVDTRTKSTSSL